MKIDTYNLCIGCMMPLGQESECRLCGLKQEEYSPVPEYLPLGTELAQRYVIGKVLGQGNFGITYIGWDKALGVRIAIKEYFPRDMVRRDTICGNDNNVYLYKKEEKAEYDSCINKFVNEAKCLARFNHVREIVSVLDFLHENNTAYIVMQYIDGVSVKEYVQKNGKMSAKRVLEMMRPTLTALGRVHDMNIIHRDISPDNIMIRKDGSLVLIDFGAAKVRNIDSNKMITLVLKKGFSPAEQYNVKSKFAEYTDIYSICASMYYMITGQIPPDATMRILEDDMPSLVSMEGLDIPVKQSKAIMKGMSVYADTRWQTMEELYDALYNNMPEKKLSLLKSFFNKKKVAVILTTAVFIMLLSICYKLGIYSIKENNSVAALKHGIAGPQHNADDIDTEVNTNIDTSTDTAGDNETHTGNTASDNSEEGKNFCILENICGLTRKEAEKILAAYDNLTVNWETSYSENVKKGKIISQDIPGGTGLSNDETFILTVTVSSGEKKVKVPKLIGLSNSDAKKKLAKINLKYEIELIESDVKKGDVIEQSIDKGDKVKEGTTVKLTVSAGRKETVDNEDDSRNNDNDFVGIIQ